MGGMRAWTDLPIIERMSLLYTRLAPNQDADPDSGQRMCAPRGTTRDGAVARSHVSSLFSPRRRILPVLVLGRSATNCRARGDLIGSQVGAALFGSDKCAARPA